MDAIKLSKMLMSFSSITPCEEGSLDWVKEILQELNFDCHIVEFPDGPEIIVRNLYAKYGNARPNLCFAGHVDVVPPGNLVDWKCPPFSPEVRDGILYGRGAVDMKSSIAAFIAAVSRLDLRQINGSVSFLLSSNEEGAKETNGTLGMLKWLTERGEKLDFCIVGEASSEREFGDMVKIGRRGILSFQIECRGKQGHVAYPHLADNPIDRMVKILNEIVHLKLDDGTEYFLPSNCEIVSVDVGNKAYNVIPGSITSRLNVRYNTLYTAESLIAKFRTVCDRVTDNYMLTVTSKRPKEPFLMKVTQNVSLIMNVINKHTGNEVKVSTFGGTSDAGFIKDYCDDLVEFGLVSKTAHHINESTPIADIYSLADVYQEFILKFFLLNQNKFAHTLL